MEGEAPKEAQIVSVYCIVVVFLQADCGFVAFHVIGQIDPDAADRVLYDPVDK